MPRKKITKQKSNIFLLKKILTASSFLLITAGILGLLFSPSPKPKSSSFLSKEITKNFLLPNSLTKQKENVNVLSSSIAAIEKFISPSPTPTPIQFFKHSKFGFSFEIPENGKVKETDPSNIIFVENSSGGAFVEIPNRLQVEVAVVNLQGLNIFQYYHNRLATIFSDKIIGFQDATESASLKGYEIFLQNGFSKQKKTLMFLNFRGNQILEIETVYLKTKNEKEEQIFKRLIETLKTY